MVRARFLLAACLLWGPFVGCAQRWHCATPWSADHPHMSDLLATGERGTLRLAVDSSERSFNDSEFEYHTLSPRECQCLAVERSKLGNMLADQSRKLMCEAKHKDPCECVLPQLLDSAALEARNRTAGTALELYYTIARLEAQKKLLDLAIAELDDAVAEVDEVRRQTITLPLKVEGFMQQRLESGQKLIELELGITRANRELAKLLDVEWGDGSTRVWPQTELRVVRKTIDIDQAIDRAVAERPELDVAWQLATSDCIAQLPTMKAALGGYSAFLAASPLPGSRLFGKLVTEWLNEPDELKARQRQLQQLAEQRERETRDEVRMNVATIYGRHDAAVFAKQAVIHWDQRVDELRQARDVNKSDWAELVEAKLKRLEAQSQLVEAVTAWKIALMKLHETQGRLVYDCLNCNY
ncbi:MAG: TolC family protein [Planctomycetaceae bacterium]|nr:TolC family protein [Planctomycetaceae bacterium]